MGEPAKMTELTEMLFWVGGGEPKENELYEATRVHMGASWQI